MIANNQPDGTLTVMDVARLLQLNPETVRRWAREGKIPATKWGNMILFEADKIGDRRVKRVA